jgi:DnaJ-class molecular chaperone
MNVFQRYLDSGEIRTGKDLKKRFWILAKNLHPDLSTIEDAERLFIRLKSDFDELFDKIQGQAGEPERIPRYFP